MFADFDLGNLRPGLFVVVVIVAVVAQAIFRGKKLLQDTWTEETWQPKSPGDWSTESEPTVLGRHTRTPSAPPPMTTPSSPRPGGAWEAELERILRGEPATSAAPPPLPPPPPPTSVRPVTFDYNQDTDLESAPAPSVPLATWREAEAGLAHADQAYNEGASLRDQINERMRAVNTRVQQHLPTSAVAPTERSAESAAVRAWLKQPDTARAAFVAALVFGPPKALES